MDRFGKLSTLALAIGAGALLFVVPATAVAAPVVVFDSFGPGNTYKTTVVWGISGAATSGGYRGQAEWFVPSLSGNLSSFTLATYRAAGSGRSNFSIAEDNGSGTLGTILENFLNRANNANGLLTISSASQPLLQAGVRYWLCDEPTDSTTVNGWFQNNQNYTPGFAFERSPWSWSLVDPTSAPSGVFRVSVTPVPEPSTMGVLIPGACLLIHRFRRGAAKVSRFASTASPAELR